jgi:SAM-dependent methyltransferase
VAIKRGRFDLALPDRVAQDRATGQHGVGVKRRGAMPSETSPGYVLGSAAECDRLERQAVLAGIAGHLRHLHVPDGAHILDAGCGSGSMARLFASRFPDAQVAGLDVNPDHVDFARRLAARDRLVNLAFRQGDIRNIPFPDGSFDLVWSRFGFGFVEHLEEAVREFRRVTRSGGQAFALADDMAVMGNWPEDPVLQPQIEALFPRLWDPLASRKLAHLFIRAGFADVSVRIEAAPLYTILGRIDPDRRDNLEMLLRAAAARIAGILGGEAAFEAFLGRFLAYLDRPDTCTYTPLYWIRGVAP